MILRHIKTVNILFAGLLICMLIPVDIHAMSEPEKKLTCRTISGQRIEIRHIDKLRVPFEVVNERGRSIIAFNSRRLEGVPKPIILFEQARHCIELTSRVTSISRERTTNMTETDKDCNAVKLLIEQRLITSREFRQIVDFYTNWNDINMTQRGGDARRVSQLLTCYKNQKNAPRPPSNLKFRR